MTNSTNTSHTDTLLYNPWKRKLRNKLPVNETSSVDHNTSPLKFEEHHRTEEDCISPRFKSADMTMRSLQKKGGQKRKLVNQRVATPPVKRPQTQGAAESRPEVARDDAIVTRRNTSSSHASPSAPPRGNTTAENNPFAPSPIPQGAEIAAHRSQRGQRGDQLQHTSSRQNLTVEVMHDLLQQSEHRVVKQIVSQQRVLLDQIETIEDIVKCMPPTLSTVKSSLTDLKLMVLPGSNANSSHHTSSRIRNQTKAGALQKEVFLANPTLPAELKIVFDTDVACVAAAKCIASQMVKFHRTRDSVTITARVMNVILYGLRKEMPKSTFKDGIGFRHAEFRFKIARLVLELAKALPEHIFTVADTTYTRDAREDDCTRIEKKPSWLTSDLVNSASMVLARKHHECIKSEVPADPSMPEKRKSLVIAKSIVKVVIDMLRLSRDKSRLRMFEDGIYCLVNWESLAWFPDHLSNPKLSFFWPEVEVVSATTIPECSVGDEEDVSDANSAHLKRIITERKEMLIEAIYDVIVTKPFILNGRKKNGVAEKKSLRRVINVLRIAMSFLCGFCHISEDSLLRTHPAMLQCVYRIALVIRAMFQFRMENRTSSTIPETGLTRDAGDEAIGNRRESTGETNNAEANECDPVTQTRRQQANAADDPTLTRRKTNPIKLGGLIPSDSDRDRIIQNAVNLSLDAYIRINAPMDCADERTQHHSGRDNEGESSSDMDAVVDCYDSGDDDMADMVDNEH